MGHFFDYGQISLEAISLRRMDLEMAISNVLHNLGDDIDKRGADLHMESPLPAVMANPIALSQVLTNLLSNALKFVKPDTKPKIMIRAKEAEDTVELEIEHNRIEAEPSMQAKIFQVCERVDATNQLGNGHRARIVEKDFRRCEERSDCAPQLVLDLPFGYSCSRRHEVGRWGFYTR